MPTKQFVESNRESGYTIQRARSGYRVERWSTLPGERTGAVWLVSDLTAKRINPDADAKWGLHGRGLSLVKHCLERGVGVSVVSEGYEVKS